MANQYARALLSAAGAGGIPIPIVATAIGSGTLIHQAVNNNTGQFDEVYIWIANLDSVDHTVTVAIGGSADGNLWMKTFDVPPNSPPIPVITGLTCCNNLQITMAADVASKVNAFGHINTIR